MDWQTFLPTLFGAVIGGGIVIFGQWLSHRHQRAMSRIDDQRRRIIEAQDAITEQIIANADDPANNAGFHAGAAISRVADDDLRERLNRSWTLANDMDYQASEEHVATSKRALAQSLGAVDSRVTELLKDL